MVSAGFCPRIRTLQFYLLDDDDINRLASVNVKTYETFISNDVPVPGGLCDPRMGAIVNLYNCISCGHNHHLCPGHFGAYKIGTTVLQPIAQEDVIKWLKIVCLKCGTLLVHPSKFKDKPIKQRLQFAATLQTTYKVCPECNEVHPKLKNSEDNIFFMTVIKGNEVIDIMKWDDIWSILQKISNETCLLLGVSIKSHPKKYYITSMLVPPITIRPNFKNHLTNKSHRTSPLLDFQKHIIRKSRIKGSEEQNEKNNLFINRCIYDMIRGGSQKRGETRMQNIIAGSTNDALIKSLSGKKGRIRNFLMGHRGFNGARVTISGNATLHLNQVGIPVYVTRTLLVAEVVRDYNKDILWNYVQEGICPRIKKYSTNKEHIITDLNRDNIILEHGDIIYRHIIDGDLVNFNRQPSLKESAIGAHRALTFNNDQQNTFQINVGICTNYNADFDGDQMLLKVLTSCRSLVEAKYITSVDRWLLSQQHGRPLNGQVQDAVVGSALLTKSGIKLDKMQVMKLFARTEIGDIVFDKKEYTGREIISLLLKRTPITYKTKPSYFKESYKSYIDYKEEDINVVIEKGIVKSGILDKATIGEELLGGPFHLIALEYGTRKALDVIFQYQQLIMEFLNIRGFSMGLDNLFISQPSRIVIDRIVSNKMIESNNYAQRYIRGQITAPLGMTLDNFYEQNQLKILSSGDNILGTILSNISSDDNDLFNMMIYGSKGKPNQMVEMMGVRGAVTLEGKRMPKLFSPWRCSTYFPRYAMDPTSRGYVRDPLTEGFSPDTMAFSAQSARQMLVQKSQSTALTGANQRKHIKNMENAITNNFRQTTKSHMLVQFLYGEDGFDPRYSIQQKVITIFMNNIELKDHFYIKFKHSDKELNILKEERDWMRNVLIRLDETGMEYKGFNNTINYGIHMDSIMNDYIQDDLVEQDRDRRLEEKYNLTTDYIDNIFYFYSNERQKSLKTPMPRYITSSVKALQVILHIKLCTKILSHITLRNLKLLLDNISLKLKRSLIPAGSCVGIQAGQGVGEPLTQAMLDAIHGASSGARAGLESIKEILGSKYALPETNSMVIRCKENIAYDKNKVSEIAEYIKRLKIIDVYTSWQIFLEKLGEPIHSKYKHEASLIKKFVNNYSSVNINDLSRWVIRIELNKSLITYKSISMETMIETIYKYINNIYIVYTTEHDDVVLLRIYIKERMLIRESHIEYFIKEVLINRILNINIRGLSEILDSKVIPLKIYNIDKNGAIVSNNVFGIKTVGQDIKHLLGLPEKILIHIDMDNISIGSVMDTLDLYGVESARIKIVEQMMDRMEGKHPNYHHLALYADILTWGGDVKSIEKAVFMERNKTFATASGYAAGQVLMRAALKGVSDDTDNIPAPIMLGTLPRFGTNYSQILMNEEFIKNNSNNVLDILMS